VGSQPQMSFVDRSPRNPDWYPVSRGDMKSVCVGPYHYIKNGDGVEEVYNVADDSLETQELSDTREGREITKECRHHLEDYLGEIG
jgi:hypothetical protein